MAALLEGVERVEPETPVRWEAAVVGRSVATLVMDARPPRAAEVRFAAYAAPAQAGGETANAMLHKEQVVLEEGEETARDILQGSWTNEKEGAGASLVYLAATR